MNSPVGRTVTVVGTGRAAVFPDTARIDVTVEARDANVAVAYAEVNTLVGQVVAALDEQGVGESDRQTQQVSLRPHYEHSQSTMSTTLVAYIASVGLRLRLGRLDAVPGVLDAVVGAAGGSVTLGGFALDSSTLDEARARAENAAMADARERAQRLAETGGAALGAVLTIRDDIQAGHPGAARATGLGWYSESAGAGAAVEAGENVLAARVVVTYTLDARPDAT